MKYILEVYSPFYNEFKKYSLSRYPYVDWDTSNVIYTNSKEQLIMTMDVLGIREDMKFYRFMRNGGVDSNPILYAVMSNFNDESELLDKHHNFGNKTE